MIKLKQTKQFSKDFLKRWKINPYVSIHRKGWVTTTTAGDWNGSGNSFHPEKNRYRINFPKDHFKVIGASKLNFDLRRAFKRSLAWLRVWLPLVIFGAVAVLAASLIYAMYYNLVNTNNF